jgi:hypothetical protein
MGTLVSLSHGEVLFILIQPVSHPEIACLVSSWNELVCVLTRACKEALASSRPPAQTWKDPQSEGDSSGDQFIGT